MRVGLTETINETADALRIGPRLFDPHRPALTGGFLRLWAIIHTHYYQQGQPMRAISSEGVGLVIDEGYGLGARR